MSDYSVVRLPPPPPKQSQRRGISSPLLGTSLRFVEYPPIGMLFARSESDAQSVIYLKAQETASLKRGVQGERTVLSLDKGRVREGFPLNNVTYEVAKESIEGKLPKVSPVFVDSSLQRLSRHPRQKDDKT